MKNLRMLMLFLLVGSSMMAQEYFPKNDGVKTTNTNAYLLTNATLYLKPGQVIQNGSLLIKEGKIAAVGSSVTAPANAVVMDLQGKSIFPSFIDPFGTFGVSKPKRAAGSGRSPQYEASRAGFYWNDHVMPEQRAVEHFNYDKKSASAMRAAGFGVVNAHREDGIARGTGILVALNDQGNSAERLLEDESGQYFSFSKSIASRQSYPTSLMGSTALMRQLYHDMNWYRSGRVATTDRSLEALIDNQGLAQLFVAGNQGNVLRAAKIGKQFGISYAILGGGDEYEYLDKLKQMGNTLVLPLNFPAAYEVSNPYQADYVNLSDMRHWNQAPSNAAQVSKAGIPFALTTQGLKSPKEFLGAVRKAMKYGLSEEQALRALTMTPAQILGQTAKVGSLEKGKWANFVIASGAPFDASTTYFENWVQGKKHVLADMDLIDLRGNYTLNAGGLVTKMSISGTASKPKIKVSKDSTDYPSKITYEDNWLAVRFTTDAGDLYRLTGKVMENNQIIRGRLLLPTGQESQFRANLTEAFAEKEKKAKTEEAPEVLPLLYPNVGYGNAQKPQSQDVLFKGATVWTGTEILENTDVLVTKGKIAKVGKDLKASGAQVIDATGKHLTAGIIDEHSHIAGLSINEAGHNSSAEVRMKDVVDPKDIDIYRNLAGGVTTIQLLHGSANPIGGRSAILKLKWGEDAEGLLFPDAPKFIKFALGENVKQSNWQSYSRFPQTRMGVEQVFINYFQRAREYGKLKASGQPFRYDEEMEVMLEILNKERFISCHSYVQSEINMLMKVAEKFNFRVNTFTHILEGYKVADKMAEHGVGGSTFSDWWAYKYEVKDAIPFNAAIMHRAGVTVAINSDDAEMSRRLNQEAAKTVKYGGMSEIEAWQMVTLNAAKLLRIDNRVGSIEKGKDADLVLWSDHPLSVYAKAEKTMIEGAVYFDKQQDLAKRTAIDEQKNMLVRKMLKVKASGGKTQPARQNKKPRFECETL